MKTILFTFVLLWAPLTLRGAAEEQIEETTVQAPKIRNSVASLLEARKQTSVVADVLSQESMARSGDSDAASSLRRVTGLTLVNGRFVYVRGLGERYSSVLLNGSQVPSPEPTRRVVPLDLFPISVLESISVQKSFSPDRPAEFGGGLIDLQTKPLPKKFVGQFSLGLNGDNFREGIDHVGGRSDGFGIDDGRRALPQSIRTALSSGRRLVPNNPPGISNGVSGEELTAMGRELQNNYRTTSGPSEAIPNFNASLGNAWSLRGLRTGASLGLLYNQNTDTGTRRSDSYNVGGQNELLLDTKTESRFSEREVQLAGALDLGLESKQSSFKFTSMLLRNSTRLTDERLSVGVADSVDARRSTNLEWSERQLFLNQISGKHTTAPLDVAWRVNLSRAGRESPDQRQYTYLNQNGTFFLNTDTTGNRRIWSELEDLSQEAALDLTAKLNEKNGHKLHWKNGVVYNRKDRRSDVYRLHFKNNFAPGAAPDLTQDAEDIFQQTNIGANGFQLTNLTESADSFTGAQQQVGTYSMIDWAPGEKFNLLAGYRYEVSRQEVQTFYYYAPDTPTSSGTLEMRNLLPSLNATWKPSRRHQVRAGYGETLARPDFRELSSVPYIEDETGYEVVGNSTLMGTVIRNWDLRYEYYFGVTDYFSVGAFHKSFQSPVESLFEPGPNLRKTFDNAESAENRGLEFEGRYGLNNLSRRLRRWTLQGNVSLIDSRVSIKPEDLGVLTTDNRPLQGQSPYVANVQVLYDRPHPQVTAGLVYNVVGKRITEVGTSQRPDVYEQPFHQVDFIFNQRVGKSWGYGLRARNLLDPQAVSTQGDKTVRSRKRGRSYALTVSSYF